MVDDEKNPIIYTFPSLSSPFLLHLVQHLMVFHVNYTFASRMRVIVTYGEPELRAGETELGWAPR